MEQTFWVSVDEVAAVLRAPRRQVEQWCAFGDIPAEKRGGAWLVSPSWRARLKGAALDLLVGRDVVRASEGWT